MNGRGRSRSSRRNWRPLLIRSTGHTQFPNPDLPQYSSDSAPVSRKYRNVSAIPPEFAPPNQTHQQGGSGRVRSSEIRWGRSNRRMPACSPPNSPPTFGSPGQLGVCSFRICPKCRGKMRHNQDNRRPPNYRLRPTNSRPTVGLVVVHRITGTWLVPRSSLLGSMNRGCVWDSLAIKYTSGSPIRRGVSKCGIAQMGNPKNTSGSGACICC